MKRYSRHINLDEIGVKGQNKICNAKVLVIGAGVLAVRLFNILLLLVLEPWVSSTLIR